MEIKSIRRPWQNTQRKTSDKARFYQSSEWRQIVSHIWIRDRSLCQLCLQKGITHQLERGTKNIGRQGTVDHKIQRDLGGTDNHDNLWLIGSNHHNIKSATEGNNMRKLQ